jgi:hypothetical protein
MTPQEANRREGGLTSCRGHSGKLRAFTSKELETVKVAQKLLGAPTIVGGECSARGELKEGNKPPAGQITQKRHQKRAISCTFWLKNCRKRCCLLKST